MSKITHEQAKESLLQVYIFNDIKTNENNYVLVTEYIKQQEKQEQLFELYKKYYEIMRQETKTYFLNYMDELKSIKEKIKEKEND